MKKHSIQKTKQPKRNLVASAQLHAIDGQITVCKVLDLLETLVGSTHFEGVFPINEKIALLRRVEFVPMASLVVEIGLPHCPNGWIGIESVHQDMEIYQNNNMKILKLEKITILKYGN